MIREFPKQNFHKYDLHSHSHWSDGDLTVQELVSLAVESNLSALVLTDHASIHGWSKFSRLCSASGIITFTGAEAMATWEDIWFDILLYGFDIDNKAIKEILSNHATAMRKISDKYTKWLREHEIDVTWEKVRGRYSLPLETPPSLYYINKYRGDVFGTPHKDVGADIREARVRQIDRGEIYNKHLLNVAEVVKVVSKAGGFVSLAHPVKTSDMLSRLIKNDPDECLMKILDMAREVGIEAIEIRHSFHSAEKAELLISYAQKHNLMMTAGSDYHGDRDGGHKVNVHLGYPGLSKEEFDVILEKVS